MYALYAISVSVTWNGIRYYLARLFRVQAYPVTDYHFLITNLLRDMIKINNFSKKAEKIIMCHLLIAF